MKNTIRVIWATLVVLAVPVFGTPVTTDGTWYNFKTEFGVDYGGGVNFATNHSSFSGVYENPGLPPWTFTATPGGVLLTVLDGGELGDVYNVYDNGVLLGQTSAVGLITQPPHACGDLPDPCLVDPAMSKGTWLLDPGAHSITIEVASTPYANSFLSWFSAEQQASTPSTVPEPSSMALIGAGLLGLGALRRRRKIREN